MAITETFTNGKVTEGDGFDVLEELEVGVSPGYHLGEDLHNPVLSENFFMVEQAPMNQLGKPGPKKGTPGKPWSEERKAAHGRKIAEGKARNSANGTSRQSTTKGLGGPSKTRESKLTFATSAPSGATGEISAMHAVEVQTAIIDLFDELGKVEREAKQIDAEYNRKKVANLRKQFELRERWLDIQAAHAGQTFLVPTQLGGEEA